jgi:hypothetical protein
MGKVVPISVDRARAIRDALRKVERAMDSDFIARADSLGLVEQAFYRLIGFAPPWRLEELAHALIFVATRLDLTAENLRIVLICTRVLEEKYIRESATA